MGSAGKNADHAFQPVRHPESRTSLSLYQQIPARGLNTGKPIPVSNEEAMTLARADDAACGNGGGTGSPEAA